MTFEPSPATGGPTRYRLCDLPRRVTVRLDAAVNGGHHGRSTEGAPRTRGVIVLECPDVELLTLVAEGLTPAAIGRRMGLNERTIRRRLTRLCDRLGVSNPVQAVVWAVRHGVI